MPWFLYYRDVEKILDVKPPITRKEFVCCMRFPLTETEISTRTFNALRRSGINTLGQLTQLTESDLKKVRNLGPKCCEEIKELLAKIQSSIIRKIVYLLPTKEKAAYGSLFLV